MNKGAERREVGGYLDWISPHIPVEVTEPMKAVARRFLELGGDIYDFKHENDTVVVFWLGDIHCRVTRYGRNPQVDASLIVEIKSRQSLDDKFIYYFKNGEFHSGEVSLQGGRLNQTVPFDLDQVFEFLMGR